MRRSSDGVDRMERRQGDAMSFVRDACGIQHGRDNGRQELHLA
jgi:hypothetical protein